ncbi:MAG: LamG domain-containing protein, partial [Sedimentisphaerales bacterium]|nr:LamG domain-containing protein [Sedimentisphaerales bacterium]
MKCLKIATLILAIACLSSVASASIFFEDFESYAAGSAMHGQGGWKGWNNTASAGAPVSNAYAYSGSNSVEIVSSADLVHEFDVTGGLWILTAMQYIPSGTSGTTWFILLNTYSDNGSQDWSVQTQFVLNEGTITSSYDSGTLATIIYDQWVEIKCVIDLDNNTVDEYYNGELITTHQWDGDLHDTLQVIDLYGNGASSVYYDDIKIEAPAYAYNPQPADGTILEATWVTLKWTAGAEAVSHDVYMGEDYDAVSEGTGDTFRGNQTANYYVAGFPGFAYPNGLVPGTTYYWRIDEINDDHPDSPWRGDVWSFTVPTLKAHNPEPADGVENVIPDDVTLSWDTGFGAMVHYVYFGDNYDEVNDAVSGGVMQPGTTYSVGQLEMDKQYYWRIDEFNGMNTYKGDVWSFKTKPVIAISNPNLKGWYTFEEGAGTTVIDWSGHDRDATFRSKPQWVENGYDGGGMWFDGNDDAVVSSFTAESWSAYTVALWAKAGSTGQDQYSCVFSSHSPNTAGFQLGVDGASPGIYRYNGVNGGTVTFGTVTTNWIHIGVTCNGTRTLLYLNGTVVATINASDAEFNKFGVGLNRNEDNFFEGIIDNVRIYDIELTQEELRDAMRGDPLLAWGANPKNNTTPDIENVLPLSWSAGDEASQHDVYFGMDKDAVKLADTSDTSGIYRG